MEKTVTGPPLSEWFIDRYSGVLDSDSLKVFDAVLSERFRQLAIERFDHVIDDLGEPGRLARAAACYAVTAGTEMCAAHHAGVALTEVWGVG
jgi:hypothetical protein